MFAPAFANDQNSHPQGFSRNPAADSTRIRFVFTRSATFLRRFPERKAIADSLETPAPHIPRGIATRFPRPQADSEMTPAHRSFTTGMAGMPLPRILFFPLSIASPDNLFRFASSQPLGKPLPGMRRNRIALISGDSVGHHTDTHHQGRAPDKPKQAGKADTFFFGVRWVHRMAGLELHHRKCRPIPLPNSI
jgi:hypothetical protein